MRNFISDRVQAVPPSGIRKFFDISATMTDVISLGHRRAGFRHARRDPAGRDRVAQARPHALHQQQRHA